MQLTLYVDGYYCNQFDAVCMTALEEKAVPYSTSVALLRDGMGVPPALSSRTGHLSRVPTLQHGDFWLTESLAIVEYLDQAFPSPAYPALFPADPRARARAMQAMAFIRSDIQSVRQERYWAATIYRLPVEPLSREAEFEIEKLFKLVVMLSAAGCFAEWNISHADLAFTLYRLARTGIPLPEPSQRLLDANLIRPSVRAYIDHARPPNPPP
ncbi:MAG TPA: glutathione S-transferase N-terminal domain-containing protein [Kofleriaceae bacterium]|nr:glutathione S-transferase N-terminal domain-containing protein [Kofleriaceae bacterium]